MRKYILLSITVALSLGVAAAITWFKEWNSAMWGIPTWPGAFFLGAVAVGIAHRVFKPGTNSPAWLIGVIAGYVLLSILLGTTFAEPATSATANPYDQTRSSSVYHAIFVGGSSPGESESSSSDTHTSSSGKGAGIVVLLIIALVLLLGSAVIPHFWIAATFMGIVLLAFFTRREFQGRSGSFPALSPALIGNAGSVAIPNRADRESDNKEPALTGSASSVAFQQRTGAIPPPPLEDSLVGDDGNVAIHLQIGSSAGEAFARFWNEQLDASK